MRVDMDEESKRAYSRALVDLLTATIQDNYHTVVHECGSPKKQLLAKR